NFKMAGNRLRSFTAPTTISDGGRGSREALLLRLHSGVSLIEAGYADVFELFDPERTSQRLVEERIKRAGEKAIEGSRTAANLGSRPPYDEAKLLESRLDLEAWQKQGEAGWLGAWQHYHKVKETPWDGDAVWALAEALYQPRLLEL